MKSGAPGAVFGPRMFGDLGSRAAVDQALGRLTKAGKIRRITRGLYDVPKTHPLLGVLSPDPEAIARSIARTGRVIDFSRHQRMRRRRT